MKHTIHTKHLEVFGTAFAKRVRTAVVGIAATVSTLMTIGSAGAATVQIDPVRVNVDGEVSVNATGYFIDAGSTFTVDAEDDSWGYCTKPECVVDPSGISVLDGITAEFLPIGQAVYNRGALVGRIGTGPIFLIGKDFTGTAINSGELFLFMWDDSYGDNSGGIQVVLEGFSDTSPDPVPLPAAAWLMGLGMSWIVAIRRRSQGHVPA